MKHLGACLQRLPREPRFYRQQASSAGARRGVLPTLAPPFAALRPPAAHLPLWS